jgi:hypothetical protein
MKSFVVGEVGVPCRRPAPSYLILEQPTDLWIVSYVDINLGFHVIQRPVSGLRPTEDGRF